MYSLSDLSHLTTIFPEIHIFRQIHYCTLWKINNGNHFYNVFEGNTLSPCALIYWISNDVSWIWLIILLLYKVIKITIDKSWGLCNTRFYIKYLFPYHHFQTGKDFSLWRKKKSARFHYFDVSFLICILKEAFLHSNSWVYSFAFKFMTVHLNYSVTSTSSGKFWHLSLKCLHSFRFSLLNSVADHQAFEYGMPGSCQSREPYMFANTTDVLLVDVSVAV